MSRKAGEFASMAGDAIAIRACVSHDRCDPCQRRVNSVAKHVHPQPIGFCMGGSPQLLDESASKGGRSSYW